MVSIDASRRINRSLKLNEMPQADHKTRKKTSTLYVFTELLYRHAKEEFYNLNNLQRLIRKHPIRGGIGIRKIKVGAACSKRLVPHIQDSKVDLRRLGAPSR